MPRRSGVALASFFLTLLTTAASARAQEGWSVEVFGGAAASLPMPLTVHQAGERDIRLTAHYDTKPFTTPPYYAYRFARWANGRAWELELVHHKLYLKNAPAEVQHFEVTHGYNLLSVNRAVRRRGFALRLGAGVVIARPEATIRHKTRDERDRLFGGYYLAGPTVQIAGTRRVPLWGRVFAAVEGKLSASHAWVPIADGTAVVPNVAAHLLLGLGYAF
jgi:hypothetical protein